MMPLVEREEEHTVRSLPANSPWARELCEHGLRKHYIKSLVELDVTNARRAIRAYRNRTGHELAFFSWMVKCIADAIDQDKAVHACRYRRNQALVFEDVDISVPIERDVEGKKMPMPYVIRGANRKQLREIQAEVAEAKGRKLEHGQQVLSRPMNALLLRVFPSLPRFVRAAFWRRFDRDPFMQKRITGTVGITSVAMAGNTAAWALPISIQPLCFALGSVTKRAVMVNGKAQARDFLALTVMFDHDVIDGAPAGRFVSHLSRMVGQAHALQELAQGTGTP